MKNKVLLFTLLFTSFLPMNAQDYILTSIEMLRYDYGKASQHEKICDQIYTALQKSRTQSPYYEAYLGALEAIKAKHAWNPYSKLNHVKEGLKILQKVIALYPENIEFRYLRYSIQHHLPDFLREENLLSEDKKAIVLYIKNSPETKEVKAMVAHFLIESQRCTSEEKEFLKKSIE